jgi:hypothetical protein
MVFTVTQTLRSPQLGQNFIRVFELDPENSKKRQDYRECEGGLRWKCLHFRGCSAPVDLRCTVKLNATSEKSGVVQDGFR